MASEEVLELSAVRELAKKEYFNLIHQSASSSVVSFQKYDSVCMIYTRINVWCAQSIAGICIDHPLLRGKTQTFVPNVTKSNIREIFRSPYQFAGYDDLEAERKALAAPLKVKAVVDVGGFGDNGRAEVVAEPNCNGQWKVCKRGAQPIRITTSASHSLLSL